MKNLFILILFFTGSLFAQTEQKYHLTVKISGIKEISGNIIAALYNKEKNFPLENKEYFKKTIPVKSKKLNCIFKVPKGTYALALYHDANANKECDKNILGIPKECFAFSNNVKPRIKAPKFRDCKFDVDKDLTVEIKLICY